MTKRILFLLFTISIGYVNSQVGVGTTTPDASSVLEVQSTTQGMLTPRMTNSQRTSISTPATGLIVYQTDGIAGFYYYTGSTWVVLINGSDALPAVNGSAVTNLNATNVTSGTLSISNGGTGATTASGARVSLGLGSLATESTVSGSEISDGTITGNDVANNSISVNKISATGTASSSTYLRGDGSWSSVSGGSYSINNNTGISVNIALTNSVVDVSNFSLTSNGIVMITAFMGTNTTVGKQLFITDNANNVYAMFSNGASATGALVQYVSATACLPSGDYKIRMSANAAGSTVTSLDIRKFEF